MTRLLKILSVIVVLLVAAVIGAIAVLKSKDFNEYKGLIAEKVKDATGRDLVIAGNLKLNISLSPSVSVEGVSFANAPWGSRPQMMTLKKASAQISLLPLLFGTVTIDRVVLSGLDLLAETDKTGKGNWVFANAKPEKEAKAAPAKTAGGSSGSLDIPQVKKVQIRDVNVTYKDGTTGAVMKARLDHLDITDDGGKGLKLDVAGALDNLVYKVAGRITDLGEKVTLDDMKAQVADSDVNGRVSVDLSSPMMVTADLSSNLIDVDGFKPKGATPAKAEPAKGSKSDAKSSDRVFPNDPLPVSGLKAINADVKYKAATVKASNLAVTNVHAHVTLKNGLLVVKPAGATLSGGNVSLAMALDARNTVPLLTVDVKGDKIDYGALLKEMKITDMVKGDLNLSVDANGKGMSVRSIMADLNGGVKVTSKGGRLDLGALSALSAGVSLDSLTKAVTGGGSKSNASEDAQTLRCVYMDFPIHKGITKAKAAVVETGGFAMLGEGGANLRDETLALRFQPHAKQASLATLVQPITIAGTFAHPTFGVEAEKALSGAAVGAAAAAVATGGLSVIVGGLIGAGEAQGTDNTDYCALAFAGKPLTPASSAKSGSASGSSSKSSSGGGIGGALKGLFGH